jgi:citronellol/citronellal dehydrogenase
VLNVPNDPAGGLAVTVPTRPDALAVFAPGCFEGRTALITGGGSGIGRATAVLLATLGARVAVMGRRPEALEGTVAAAHEAGAAHEVLTASADVREPEQVDACSTLCSRTTLGRIDVLVNNAGGSSSPAEQVSHKGFARTRQPRRHLVRLDAGGGKSMIPQRDGVIESITMSPHRGMPGRSHSSAARAGVESLMRTFAVEWGRHGIRTLALAPGIVHTEAWERYGLDPDVISAVVPLARLQAADEVAAAVAWAASPAGAYLTGTTITVDGGLDVSGPGSAFGAG